ncbi:MAG: hypothetical protein IPN69_02535 [Acidobacteria bacterium]|nr:hypothetical protein [Acidobacteriota bacterium]MBK8147599.1 hypothetical protein [Acidobacteriota bacterium]MBK8809591.1 hypothetical protein [Acidobacteriota bacterium]
MLKDIILWKYERASWQWDVLCLLIMAFIFLTPKAWFDRKDRLATQTTRLIVKQQDFSPDRAELEKKVRQLSGNQTAEVVDWREKKNVKGETVYEVEMSQSAR